MFYYVASKRRHNLELTFNWNFHKKCRFRQAYNFEKDPDKFYAFLSICVLSSPPTHLKVYKYFQEQYHRYKERIGIYYL